ncbi:MAG TPA: T9SS type A sorting domain-containing protein, partial [Cytophagaceae bacterium]|nr:T9SS type A sorting domain-containing protein [Cytophagaceae bacterium]
GTGYKISLLTFTSNAGSFEQIFNGFPVTQAGVANVNGPTANYTVVGNLSFTSNNFTVTHSCASRVQVNRSCSLPVSLISFTGSNIGNKNLLSWITSSEKNNAYFEIQKSTDNMNFETIGKVNGNGTTNSIQYYNFMDNNITGTINYYRIVQYDFDGKTSISSIVSIETSSGSSVTVAPNPSHDAFNVVLSEITTADLTVLDVLGREIYTTHIAQGRSLVTFGADFQTGAYILQVKTSDQVFIQRIIKE